MGTAMLHSTLTPTPLASALLLPFSDQIFLSWAIFPSYSSQVMLETEAGVLRSAHSVMGAVLKETVAASAEGRPLALEQQAQRVQTELTAPLGSVALSLITDVITAPNLTPISWLVLPLPRAVPLVMAALAPLTHRVTAMLSLLQEVGSGEAGRRLVWVPGLFPVVSTPWNVTPTGHIALTAAIWVPPVGEVPGPGRRRGGGVGLQPDAGHGGGGARDGGGVPRAAGGVGQAGRTLRE